MFLRKLLLAILVFGIGHTYAQQSDFCDAITTIIRDAPNQFRDIRGNMIKSDYNTIFWKSGIKVPGSIGTRFVASMGLFCECAFFQTKNKSEVKPVYDKYKRLLSSCLVPKGYTLLLHPNFYPGLSDYKKLVFMREIKGDEKADTPPAHVTLETTYNKDVGKYTIVMFIFQH